MVAGVADDCAWPNVDSQPLPQRNAGAPRMSNRRALLTLSAMLAKPRT
jgi:hypothetical protein